MSALTARQMEILRLLADGMKNGDISRRLGISANTARTHVEQIRRAKPLRSSYEPRALADGVPRSRRSAGSAMVSA